MQLTTGAGTAKHISYGNPVCLNKNSSIISLEGASPYAILHVQHSFALKVMSLKSMAIPTFISVTTLQMYIT